MDLPSGVRARKVGSPAEKPYSQSNKAIKVVSRKQSSSISQVRVDTTIAADERDDTQRARFGGVRPRQTMVAGATRSPFNDGTRREDGTPAARVTDPPRQRMQFRKTMSAHPNAFANHQDNRARTKGTSYFPSSSRQSAWSDGPSYSSRDQREASHPTSLQPIDPAQHPKLAEFSRRIARTVRKSLPTIDPVTRSILELNKRGEFELSARKHQYGQDELGPRRTNIIQSGKGHSRPRWDDIENDEEPALAAKNLTASLYHGIPLVGGPVIYLNTNASAVVIRDGKVYGKAARKLHYREHISNQTARKRASSVNDREVTDIEDSSPPPDLVRHISSRPESPLGQLKDALKALTLATSMLRGANRLPFLRRNMRRGFDQSCVRRGVPTNPQVPPQKHVRFIYKKAPGGEFDSDGDEEDDHDHELEIADWCCPVCDVYGRFPTREMLQRHMEWDHDEVETEWELGGDKSWTISLVIHRASPDDDTSSQTVSPSRSPPPIGLLKTDLDTTETHGLPLSESIYSPDSPETSASVSTTQQTPTPQFKFKFQPPTIFSAAESMRASSMSSQSSSYLLPIQRQRSSSPPAALVLGSDADPLGPAMRAPLFPARLDNGSVLYYSCRPGGGKLYDLVGTLPMEPYGVLSWSVIHKEEELFEADDVRDEDKVMQALWGRWVLLNRNTFVGDYCKWVKAFVDEYWVTIQLAAGWRALRTHLLVLAQSKFLTGKETTVVLQHYEGLAGAK